RRRLHATGRRRAGRHHGRSPELAGTLAVVDAACLRAHAGRAAVALQSVGQRDDIIPSNAYVLQVMVAERGQGIDGGTPLVAAAKSFEQSAQEQGDHGGWLRWVIPAFSGRA